MLNAIIMISVVTILLVLVTKEMIQHSPFWGGTYSLPHLKLAITFFVITLISEIVIVTMTVLFRKDIFGPILRSTTTTTTTTKAKAKKNNKRMN